MDATATITPNRDDAGPLESTARTGPPRTSRPASHRGPAVFGIIIAGFLLALGIPRLLAALEALDARSVQWDAHGQAPVSPARLAEAEAGLAGAARWVSDGEMDTGRGYLLLKLAQSAPAGAERNRLWSDVETVTAAGLAKAPGQPSAWLRLAHLREVRGDAAGAAKALRLAMLSGAVVPESMRARVQMGLRLLPALDHETRGLLARQIRLTWVIDPDYVAGLSERGQAGDLVRDALADLTEEEMGHYLRRHADKAVPPESGQPRATAPATP